ASADAGGRIVSYRFDFGDGSAVTQTEPVATHTYDGGIWSLGLTVTDDAGDTASTSAKIAVNAPPVASLVLSPTSGAAPLAVSADASRSSDPDSPIASYRFDFGDGTVVGPQASPTATHTYAAGNWTATVQVADSGGAVGRPGA